MVLGPELYLNISVICAYTQYMEKQVLIQALSDNVAGACLGHKTRNLARTLTRRFDEAFRQLGITGNQYSMLVVIMLVKDASMTDLARHMGLDRTTLIRNLKPLEREGFVALSSEGYRRARSVEVTEKGAEILADALPRWQAVQDKLKQELGDEAWHAAHKAMEALNILK